MQDSGGPLVGITGWRVHGHALDQSSSDLVGSTQVDANFADYSRAIAAAQGTPVLLSREADPETLVAHLDGLILSGGQDVDPRRYDSRPGPGVEVLDPARDSFEIALLNHAMDRGVPVLGICRGCQVINVALGGTLVSHLPPDAGEAHSSLAYPSYHRTHEIVLEADARLAELYGPRARVNSFHHQAVSKAGEGVRPVARALDGVVEAIEIEGHHVVGVQWHPEWLQHDPIFAWFVGMATAYRNRRARHVTDGPGRREQVSPDELLGAQVDSPRNRVELPPM